MERDSRIPEEIRGRMPEILASWRERRRSPAEEDAFERLAARIGRLIEVFTDFLRSPDSVETFSKGGAVHALIGEIAKDQHELGRDAVGVIEDFATLRRCVWRVVESGVELSSLDGKEVAWFFGKLMQASDWVIEAGLEAYDGILREEMEAALGRAAATDLVTGLPDRDLFDRLLLPRTVEAHERFALAIFDVADFSETVASGKVKRARKILRRLAETVCEVAPPEADCARFGDDEICVILPGEDSEGAYRVAERVLDNLTRNREGFEVDVGVAEYPAHGESTGELMVETLKALKMAKRVGGSGIVVAH